MFVQDGCGFTAALIFLVALYPDVSFLCLGISRFILTTELLERIKANQGFKAYSNHNLFLVVMLFRGQSLSCDTESERSSCTISGKDKPFLIFWTPERVKVYQQGIKEGWL